MAAQAALDEDLNNTFSKALNLYLVDRLNKVGLSEAEKQETRDLLEKTKISTTRHRAQINDELIKLWDTYVPPTMTVDTVRENYEKYKLSCMRDNLEAEIKGEDGQPQGTQVPVPDFLTCVAPSGSAKAPIYKRIDPLTGTIDKDPLQFTGNISLELFDEHIVISPLSNKVNITETLSAVLSKAKDYGLTRDQLACWMKAFAMKHMPERYADISYLRDPREVFITIITSISYTGHAAKIKNEMRKLTREPGVDISIPINRYKALVVEYISIEQPYKSRSVVSDEAEKAANKLIESFVTPAMWLEVENYRKGYMRRYCKYLGVKEQLDFIAEKEEADENRFAPKETLSLKPNSAKIRIYNTMAVEDPMSPEAESYMNDAKASQSTLAAPNWGGPTPSAPPLHHTRSQGPVNTQPLHRAFETGFNQSLSLPSGSSSFSSATAGSHNTAQGQHVSRRDAPSRAAGRRFYYESPGSGALRPWNQSQGSNDRKGTNQSFQRSNKFSPSGRPKTGQSPSPYRKPHGTQNPATSPGGRPQSPGKFPICRKCFREHAPPPAVCFQYGLNPITEKMCPCGRGYHHPDVCVKKGQKSPMRRSDTRSPGPSPKAPAFNANLR